MRYRSTWTVWSLSAAMLVLAGCLSDEEPVPKYDFGKSAEQSNTGQAKAPRVPYSPDRAHRQLDENQDGTLSLDEFTRNARTPLAKKRQTGIFGVTDRNGDDRVSLDEFKNRPQEAHFRRMDIDCDGGLSPKELYAGKMDAAPAEHVERAFMLVDRNGNGLVEFDEYRSQTPEARYAGMDRDGSGLVSLAEYEAVNGFLRRYGHFQTIFDLIDKDKDLAITLEESVNKPTEVAFYKRDKDGDSLLGLEEFLAWSKGEEKIAAGTRTFYEKDFDGDGAMSLEEYLTSPEENRFRTLDSDKDGTLSLAEYAAVDSAAASQTHAERLFKVRDVNGDGTVSMEEYCMSSEEVSFIRQDSNADGKLDFSEFTAWISPSKVGTGARDDFDRMDLDKDGFLSFRERTIRPEDMDFWAFDQDNDARLQLREYRLSPGGAEDAAEDSQDEVAEEATGPERHPRDDEAWQSFFESVDTNADGQITIDEFTRQSPQGRLARLDADADGSVTSADFSQVEGIPDLAQQMAAFIESVDVNHDGKLTVEEFPDPTE